MIEESENIDGDTANANVSTEGINRDVQYACNVAHLRVIRLGKRVRASKMGDLTPSRHTDWMALQHFMSPVLQCPPSPLEYLLGTAVATAARVIAKRAEARTNIACLEWTIFDCVCCRSEEFCEMDRVLMRS